MDKVAVLVAEDNWRKGFSDCPIYRLDKLLKAPQKVLYWLRSKNNCTRRTTKILYFISLFPSLTQWAVDTASVDFLNHMLW
jgi:hypothetical protein